MKRERLIEILNKSVFTKVSDGIYYYNGSSIIVTETMVTMTLKYEENTISSICLNINLLSEGFSIRQLDPTPIVIVTISTPIAIYIKWIKIGGVKPP